MAAGVVMNVSKIVSRMNIEKMRGGRIPADKPTFNTINSTSLSTSTVSCQSVRLTLMCKHMLDKNKLAYPLQLMSVPIVADSRQLKPATNRAAIVHPPNLPEYAKAHRATV